MATKYNVGAVDLDVILQKKVKRNSRVLPTIGINTSTNFSNKIVITFVSTPDPSLSFRWEIERRVNGSGSSWTPVWISPYNYGSTNYEDSTVPAGTAYDYRVRLLGDGLYFISGEWSTSVGLRVGGTLALAKGTYDLIPDNTGFFSLISTGIGGNYSTKTLASPVSLNIERASSIQVLPGMYVPILPFSEVTKWTEITSIRTNVSSGSVTKLVQFKGKFMTVGVHNIWQTTYVNNFSSNTLSTLDNGSVSENELHPNQYFVRVNLLNDIYVL
jgi:hypothetical protein